MKDLWFAAHQYALCLETETIAAVSIPCIQPSKYEKLVKALNIEFQKHFTYFNNVRQELATFSAMSASMDGALLG